MRGFAHEEHVADPQLLDVSQAGAFDGPARMHPSAVDAYRDAVWASTAAYLATLTEADLDRELEFRPGATMTVASYFTRLMVNNNFSHVGEISVVKGLQGLKGYPV